jgi:NTP pyrophosphatase (non-canonical NTP hydrolase)
MTLQEIQEQIGEWSRKNFPNNKSYHPLLGAVEEIGELCHAHLKAEQGIRGTPEELREKKIDAVGDTIVYLADYCEREGFDIQDSLERTWNKVKERDWTRNKKNGVASDPPLFWHPV